MKPYFNLALNILYGTALPDPLDAALLRAYENGKEELHRLPSAADLDAVEREAVIRELTHSDLLQRVLANHYLTYSTEVG